MAESIQSIREEEMDEGYKEDEEDTMPQPDPRKRTYLQKLKKNLEVTSSKEYFKCAKFNQPRFNSHQNMKLNKIRTVLLIPNLILLLISLSQFEVLWFFYYFSFWGFFANLVSLLSSMRSIEYPEVWQQIAVVSTEISFSMNLVISLIFWGYLASQIFEDLDDWSRVDIFLRAYLYPLHILPFLSTCVNLYLTDITFFKKDWKIVMATGMSYMFANCIGCVVLGHRLFPVVDWEVPVVSISVFALVAGTMSLVHIAMQKLISKHKSRQRKAREQLRQKHAQECI